jgi:hypothetical protein
MRLASSAQSLVTNREDLPPSQAEQVLLEQLARRNGAGQFLHLPDSLGCEL